MQAQHNKQGINVELLIPTGREKKKERLGIPVFGLMYSGACSMRHVDILRVDKYMKMS